MKYLINAVDTYRVATIDDVDKLHEELLADNHFELVEFGYKTKYIKQKGEIVEEYQVVKTKKVFTDEKEPERQMDVSYHVPGAEVTF